MAFISRRLKLYGQSPKWLRWNLILDDYKLQQWTRNPSIPFMYDSKGTKEAGPEQLYLKRIQRLRQGWPVLKYASYHGENLTNAQEFHVDDRKLNIYFLRYLLEGHDVVTSDGLLHYHHVTYGLLRLLSVGVLAGETVLKNYQSVAPILDDLFRLTLELDTQKFEEKLIPGFTEVSVEAEVTAEVSEIVLLCLLYRNVPTFILSWALRRFCLCLQQHPCSNEFLLSLASRIKNITPTGNATNEKEQMLEFISAKVLEQRETIAASCVIKVFESFPGHNSVYLGKFESLVFDNINHLSFLDIYKIGKIVESYGGNTDFLEKWNKKLRNTSRSLSLDADIKNLLSYFISENYQNKCLLKLFEVWTHQDSLSYIQTFDLDTLCHIINYMYLCKQNCTPSYVEAAITLMLKSDYKIITVFQLHTILKAWKIGYEHVFVNKPIAARLLKTHMQFLKGVPLQQFVSDYKSVKFIEILDRQSQNLEYDQVTIIHPIQARLFKTHTQRLGGTSWHCSMEETELARFIKLVEEYLHENFYRMDVCQLLEIAASLIINNGYVPVNLQPYILSPLFLDMVNGTYQDVETREHCKQLLYVIQQAFAELGCVLQCKVDFQPDKFVSKFIKDNPTVAEIKKGVTDALTNMYGESYKVECLPTASLNSVYYSVERIDGQEETINTRLALLVLPYSACQLNSSLTLRRSFRHYLLPAEIYNISQLIDTHNIVQVKESKVLGAIRSGYCQKLLEAIILENLQIKEMTKVQLADGSS
ncbi:uncharacterized protein LOC128233549 isoform X2 [Mya arenaria]|uniref:uncharacterized protein LOC128233549 isoform X2 n=1 Tax=Mya arenaria TaxID=6604 RepID=UPI0022E44BC3|nr:uncharacterized protein LOC128233549 isoform X2 [Mya arenaria]